MPLGLPQQGRAALDGSARAACGVQGGVGWLHHRVRKLALANWAKNQRIYGRAFKKPASERSKAEKKYASKTTKRRVALLDGIGFLD